MNSLVSNNSRNLQLRKKQNWTIIFCFCFHSSYEWGLQLLVLFHIYEAMPLHIDKFNIRKVDIEMNSKHFLRNFDEHLIHNLVQNLQESTLQDFLNVRNTENDKIQINGSRIIRRDAAANQSFHLKLAFRKKNFTMKY